MATLDFLPIQLENVSFPHFHYVDINFTFVAFFLTLCSPLPRFPSHLYSVYPCVCVSFNVYGFFSVYNLHKWHIKYYKKRVIFTTFSTYFLLSTLSWVGYCRCWFRYHPSLRSFASSPFESHKCCCRKSSAHTHTLLNLFIKTLLRFFAIIFFEKNMNYMNGILWIEKTF